MPNEEKRFAEALQALAQKGFTQAAVGDRIGAAAQVISDLKNGRRQLSYAIALRLEEEFGIDHDWLLTGRGSIWRLPGQSAGELPQIAQSLTLLPLMESIVTRRPQEEGLWSMSLHPVPPQLALSEAGAIRYVLRIRNDDMAPQLTSGDLVVIENRPAINFAEAHGRICTVKIQQEPPVIREAAMIQTGGEAHLELRAANPATPSIRMTAPEARQQLAILGVVVTLLWRAY
jgi:SOS-response transcriptional repressor LexA